MTPNIFSGWMGTNVMPETRSGALISLIRHSGCSNTHLTTDTLGSWVDPKFPLHPLFNLLSAVHKCDYLRCYLLHVHGGGYADVKHTSKSWIPFFKRLEQSPAFGLGYTEIGPQGVANVGGDLEVEMKANYSNLIGLCAMIFRKQTIFTDEWYRGTWNLMEEKSESLIRNPARHPQDRRGVQFTDGSLSDYPFEWTEVGGNIFHPLVWKYREYILHDDIAPSFENYR